MAEITIKGNQYQVKKFAGELALVAAIKLDGDLFASYSKHNDFVEALTKQLKRFDPEEIAVKQDGEWVLSLTFEQWFQILSDLQLIAYKDLVTSAIESIDPQSLLAEKRAIENLAFVTAQRTAFDKCMAAYDDHWAEKVTQSNISKSADYYKILADHWLPRQSQENSKAKEFIKAQLAQIPNAYKSRQSTDD